MIKQKIKEKPTQLKEFSNFVIFKTDEGKVNVDVLFADDTLWLTQKSIAKLFEKDRSVITKHLKNIFDSGELEETAVCAYFAHTAEDGKNYNTNYYNLRVVTAIGYKVNSHRAIIFRRWATEILHDYIIKGSVLDVERLKNIQHFGKDYFDETIEKIREIRLSERRLYQKTTDLYALSADYDKEDPKTKEFFANVQNKLHWSITGRTAAEIIYTEADAKKVFMGLKTWKNAPKGKILRSDVTIAKNYLNREHIKSLERIVSAYLDLAEERAKRGIVMNMKDWVIYLDKFLEISDYPILKNTGKVSALEAKIKAEAEYEKFRIVQDREYISDFDREIEEKLKNLPKNT